MLRGVIIALGLIFCVQACAPRLRSAYVTPEEIQRDTIAARDDVKFYGHCNEALDYAPDLRYPKQTPPIAISVNVHFMDAGDGLYNLGKDEARAFVAEMLASCNAKLATNTKMHLPLGNDTPVLPVPWYFELAPDPDIPGHDGIYFHNDPELFYFIHGKNTNRSSRAVIEKYTVRPDSVLNLFMMPHHPDSLKSETYFPTGTGITLGTSIKMVQVFKPGLTPQSCVGLLNHEAGHALGLSHSWGGADGCDDTPANPNCWYYTDTPPCDSLVSNNMMDYNAWQAALTPCQIGRVLRNVANLSSRVRKLIRPDWCTYDSSMTIVVHDERVWLGAKDLSGDIRVERGGVLRLTCRVSLAAGAKIIVEPGGKLILDGCRLHNACGEEWDGIEVRSLGKEQGIVQIVRIPQIENVVHVVDLTSFE